MNIAQQKNLIAITKRALALLDPDWLVTCDLQAAFALACVEHHDDKAKPAVKKAPSRKLKKSELYTCRPINIDECVKHIEPKGKMVPALKSDPNGPQIWTPAKDAVTSCQCAGCQIRAGFWNRGMKATSNIANEAKNKIDATAVRDSLKVCGCSHDADRHEEDELNNLLKCSDCECEQFHYGDDQKQAA